VVQAGRICFVVRLGEDQVILEYQGVEATDVHGRIEPAGLIEECRPGEAVIGRIIEPLVALGPNQVVSM
jgi:hypothetical protein